MVSKKANVLIKASTSEEGNLLSVELHLEGNGAALIALLATILNNDEDVLNLVSEAVSLVKTKNDYKAQNVKATTKA